MLRAIVHASEDTDVGNTIADLRNKCQRAGLPLTDVELIAAEAQTALAALIDAGKQLGATGSRMHVTRVIAGGGYRVELVFGAGSRNTWWQKLLDRLRGR